MWNATTTTSATPPIWIEVQTAQSNYIYGATGVNVPYNKHEFVMAVSALLATDAPTGLSDNGIPDIGDT